MFEKGKQISLQDAMNAEEGTVFLSKWDGMAPVRLHNGKLVYHFTDSEFNTSQHYGVLPFIVIGVISQQQ